jgi:putative endopeptidase
MRLRSPVALVVSLTLLTLLLGGVAFAQTTSRPGVTPAVDNAAAQTAALDPKISPCSDFFQFSCGGWLARNPIPAEHSRWGRMQELDERNLLQLREILEQYARPERSRSAGEQKIGDAYSACMDEPAIEAKGVRPLKVELDRIARLKTKADLIALVARLHGAGINALFEFGSGQDFKNAEQMIAVLDQGGLGLPDRDFYLKTDAKSAERRTKYTAHVQRMLELAGVPATAAVEQAAAIMRIETELAQSSQSRVFRREPANRYHKMTMAELEKLAPTLNWTRYYAAIGAPAFTSLNVVAPDFVKALSGLIDSMSLADWKAYVRWHLVHGLVAVLPRSFVNEDFAFFGQALTGAQELRPRWKRCVKMVDGDVGFALGEKFVERTFGADGKARMVRLVRAIERAFEDDINQLPWMSGETRRHALEKLHAITNNIGYPEKWRDYRRLTVRRGDAFGNHLRAAEFELRRELVKIGQRVDRSEWYMTPQTVNAYYSWNLNSINFPAGILQPPFFDKNADDAANLGGIGTVIAHEISHGFDDSGSKFDARGDLREWWKPKDAAEFERRAGCFVKEYGGFTAVDDLKLNGKLTLGENIADNGGLRIALMALRHLTAGKPDPRVSGYTGEQRLFIANAQVWCTHTRPELARTRVLTDPHSPPRFRINGVMPNLPEFARAFGCRAGQPMVREPVCRVW